MLYLICCAQRRAKFARMLFIALCALGGAASYAQNASPEPVAAAMVATTVNINTADAVTLARMLNGVGQSRAEEIVRYREAFGPFKTIEELAEVKGIGEATVDRNRPVIVLE